MPVVPAGMSYGRSSSTSCCARPHHVHGPQRSRTAAQLASYTCRRRSSPGGTIVYEVPADATQLRLQFKCDLFSTGTAEVALP